MTFEPNEFFFLESSFIFQAKKSFLPSEAFNFFPPHQKKKPRLGDPSFLISTSLVVMTSSRQESPSTVTEIDPCTIFGFIKIYFLHN